MILALGSLLWFWPQTLVQAVASIVFFLWWVWIFYSNRYMRIRVLSAEKGVAPLLPEGEEEFHRLFGRISALRPQVVFWVILAMIFATPSIMLSKPVGWAFTNLIFTLGGASALWVYSMSLRGIRKLGRVKLNFRSYYADHTMGLRPIGSLALALAVAFLGILGLAAVVVTSEAAAYGLDSATGILFYTIDSAFAILGLALFFLPMMGLHRQMVQHKLLENGRLMEKLERIVQDTGQGSPNDLNHLLSSNLELSRLELLRRELSLTTTWPFDITILSKLFAISLSLAVILSARVIANILHI